LSAITFHIEDISYTVKNKNHIKSVIKTAIADEAKKLGEIAFICCSDDYLHKINQEYLKHDTFTDIITFDYCENDVVSGDIFISIERVKENAIKFNQNIENELFRIIIHGVLHLLGYKDKSPNDKKIMTDKEDFYLTLYSNK